MFHSYYASKISITTYQNVTNEYICNKMSTNKTIKPSSYYIVQELHLRVHSDKTKTRCASCSSCLATISLHAIEA